VNERFFRALAKQAAARFPARDRTARHFAYGKLKGDPVFHHLLAHGLIPRGSRVLDLGCGQGVLGALLQTAKECHAAREWPQAWPPPPNPRRVCGIDLRQKDVDRARAANIEGAEWIRGDIRSTEFGPADAVVLLDVLHYIEYSEQESVLKRARDSLGGRGVIILRVGDASGSLRFRFTLAVDRAVMRLRGHRFARLHCKPLAQWQRELTELGFVVDAVPMSAGTPFANVLLLARLAPRTSHLVSHSCLLP
jgi:SAM-dependent methyltransferase